MDGHHRSIQILRHIHQIQKVLIIIIKLYNYDEFSLTQ